MEGPILVAPNWEKEFHVHVDASTFAVGSMLCQPDEKGSDHPIYYASRQLSVVEEIHHN